MSFVSTAAFETVVVPLEFVVAAEGDPGALEAGGYRLVLHPATRRSLEIGAQLARDGGKLVLVHATPSLVHASLYASPEGTWLPHDSIRDLDERATRTATKVLQDLAARLCQGSNVDVRAAAGTPIDIILEVANDVKADVIVLPTSGRGRAKRFFLGSTADKVIRQAECPVLVVPERP
jgi:nucleotide-binding universal stress UspA family protein